MYTCVYTYKYQVHTLRVNALHWSQHIDTTVFSEFFYVLSIYRTHFVVVLAVVLLLCKQYILIRNAMINAVKINGYTRRTRALIMTITYYAFFF